MAQPVGFLTFDFVRLPKASVEYYIGLRVLNVDLLKYAKLDQGYSSLSSMLFSKHPVACFNSSIEHGFDALAPNRGTSE